MPTWPHTYHEAYQDNPEGEFAAYKLLRSDIQKDLKDTDQKGKKAFGIEHTHEGVEVVIGDDQELVDYNIDLGLIAPNTEFDMLVRKESTKALQNLPEKNLRGVLRKLLDTI